MDAETLQALNESIAHWERLASGNRHDGEWVSASECALCRMFYMVRKSCEGCPVMSATGMEMCDGSPYGNASRTYSRKKECLGTREAALNSAEFRSAAKRELEFLRSLLPPSSESSETPALP